ncbi:IgA-specific serine endopeptidase [Canicola haemoglobinophilus]|uniref:IgA-specific serine endopeptidase n=1 Tax=Canicola haemoglobinophilus TaxID=733 RepID=A0AB38HG52_9PAST|nr:Adhesion and penetration protein precursor [Canicola haemoglobinophilus]STO69185.1 IgA-specific serine endopeptidase [Canicola haemoglobinophilus]
MKNNLKLTALAIFTHLIFQQIAYASVVRDDVDYQYFRDFAENKGKFFVGASNIAIHNKNGDLVGIAMRDLPMPDLSAVVRDGFATAISPQYINSVKHNTGYGSVQFGGATKNPDANHYNYLVVDRNDFLGEDKGINADYHLPRLHKLITEIEPTVITSAGSASRTYLNKNRFPSFARVGAGTQGTRDPNNVTTRIADPYRYLLGGTPLNITRGDLNGWADANGNLFEDYYGPLANYAAAEDSGSPLWVFDKQENR